MGFAELRHGLEQADQATVIADVHAPARGVLADEVEFDAAVVEKALRFVADVRTGLRSELAANRGDRAERALLIASLRDAEVGPVARGESESVGISVLNIIQLKITAWRLTDCPRGAK